MGEFWSKVLLRWFFLSKPSLFSVFAQKVLTLGGGWIKICKQSREKAVSETADSECRDRPDKERFFYAQSDFA